jgi:hypothetical protein
MSIGKKLYFFLRIKVYFLLQWIKTIFQYYSNIKFMFFDIFFSFIYLFFNPYRISRKFLEKKEYKKIYDYGETPLHEMEKIIKECNIQKQDKILELGAGRGKISFWLNYFVKCHITAIEQIPLFVKIANFFIKLFKIKNLNFICRDFFNFEFNSFNVIYLYGTTLNDEKIKALINKFKKLSSYVKIITISYSLNEYDDDFICKKSFNISFPWGQTKAYLNIKRSR